LPINTSDLLKNIQDRLSDIRECAEKERVVSDHGKLLIEKIKDLDLTEFTELLSSPPAGALPISEGSESEMDWRFIRQFPHQFKNREEALDWARNILKHKAVAAVDGSQIYPGSEFSVPIGLVNTGWYINYHSGEHELDHSSRVLLPDELGFNPETGVNLKRHEAEIEKLMELMDRLATEDLVLLDGSLVVSFALHVFETIRNEYIASILGLLELCKEARKPLFAAYVDASKANS